MPLPHERETRTARLDHLIWARQNLRGAANRAEAKADTWITLAEQLDGSDELHRACQKALTEWYSACRVWILAIHTLREADARVNTPLLEAEPSSSGLSSST